MLLGTRILFCEVNLNLSAKQRYGIVGANGCGKSTFLKLLNKEEECSEGEIVIAKSATIASLTQDQFQYEDELILNVVLRGKEKLWQAMQEKETILQVGDFSTKAGMKLAIIEQKKHALDGITKRIDRMQVFIDRFRAKANKAKQVQSKIKLVDKIEMPEIEKSSRLSPNFDFTCKVRSGKQVVIVENISKSYAEKMVLDNISFKLNRHDKLAIIGHNGIGKSTLLKILMQKITQDNGSYEWGHEVHISYFMQDHHELINKSCSVLDWLEDHRPADVTSNQVRKTLGMVLFTQDDVGKNVLSLSGGEMARLILAKIMLERSNVLVLDEPTNHLDIESIDGLIKSLQNYAGTLVFVSHDRYFSEKIANRVLAITEAGINDFHGSYHEFIQDCGADYLNQIFVKSVSRV